VASARLDPAATGGYRVRIAYRIGTDLYERAAPLESVMSVLLGKSLDLVCSASFRYLPEDGEQVVELPLVPAQTGKTHVEIRGMRLTSVSENGSILHTIVLDRPGNQRIQHSISFELRREWNRGTPSAVLRYASDISTVYFRLKAVARDAPE
jgi:hypothetical protein